MANKANKNRIIIMAKMALYDKKHGVDDRVVFSYFRRDYIYRKNMWTRLCVAAGATFLLAVYWLHQLFIYGVDIQELDIRQSVTDSVLFLIAVMAFYTFVGTIQGTHQYHQVKRRVENYISLMQRLERLPGSGGSASSAPGSGGSVGSVPGSAEENSDLVYDERQRRTKR